MAFLPCLLSLKVMDLRFTQLAAYINVDKTDAYNYHHLFIHSAVWDGFIPGLVVTSLLASEPQFSSA